MFSDEITIKNRVNRYLFKAVSKINLGLQVNFIELLKEHLKQVLQKKRQELLKDVRVSTYPPHNQLGETETSQICG